MSICEPRRPFSDHLADRVHELGMERRLLREENRKLRASRDLWKLRALRKALR